MKTLLLAFAILSSPLNQALAACGPPACPVPPRQGGGHGLPPPGGARLAAFPCIPGDDCDRYTDPCRNLAAPPIEAALPCIPGDCYFPPRPLPPRPPRCR